MESLFELALPVLERRHQRRDFLLQLAEFDFGQSFKQPSCGKDNKCQAKYRGYKVRLFLVKTVPATRALRQQIKLDRATCQVAQPQTHDFPQGMSHGHQIFQVDG
jgi:hypothetical protein